MKATTFHKGQHLDASDIEPAYRECPICLATAIRRPVLRIQDSPEINMLECPHCRGCSASHMPTTAVLDKYYSQYYRQSSLKTTTSNKQRFARHVITPIQTVHPTNSIRILDYGGGDGSLAYSIAEIFLQRNLKTMNHVEIDLVDYQEPQKTNNIRVSIGAHHSLDTVQGHYDLILASAVLEHVPHVYSIIRKLVALSKPGAYFYARTPFMIPIGRFLGQMDLTYPAHVHDMGSSFWNRFVQTFGLSADLVMSRPSLIETTLVEAPLRTILAFLMKLPSHLELALRRSHPQDPRWTLVGGWEVMLRFRGIDV